MKTSLVQIVFTLLCTVFAAALQDMAPSFGGVKPPFLLALALFAAAAERRPDARDGRAAPRHPLLAARGLPCALLAGAFEDALSGFPAGCAAGFFVLAYAGARLLRDTARALRPAARGLVTVTAAAPLHELWLATWGVVGDDPSGFVRFFACALPAACAGALAFALLPRLVRFAGLEAEADLEGRALT